MTDIKVYGELLATEDNRVLRYRLLPFGSIGRTNVGAVLASEKSVEIPEDISHLTLNTEHNQMTPVGRFVEITKGDDGLYASVSISKFKRGDEALALTASGEMTGISVEVAGAVIQDGKLVGGELIGAALCKKPAFPDAVLMASNTDAVEEALEALSSAVEGLTEALVNDSEAPAEEEIPEVTETPEETLIDSSDEEEDPLKKGLTAMENSAIPTALTASNGGSAQPADLKSAVALIAQAYDNGDTVLASAMERAGVVGSTNMFAALSPVSETSNPVQAAWLGELWKGKTYVRKYASLVSTAPLTARKVEGWRFVTTPVVGDYAGFPAEVPTNTVTTEAFSETSAMIAGGWKIDRSHADFGDTEFLNSFFKAATEDYARKSDLKVLSKLVAEATDVEAGEAPAGVNEGMAKIIDGVISMIDFATPSFALVAPDVYRSILLTRSDDSLLYLSSALGFEDGTVGSFRLVPAPELAPGTVIVAAKEAVTLYELPGTPIRVSALDVAHNGTDEAIFGYFALVVNNAKGIVNVTPYVA